MPTYEYECQKCPHKFEKFQGMNDPPEKRCPKCRGKVRRLVGRGAGIIFKGSGFYQTDYRSAGYKQAASAESGASKPASKPDKTDKTEKTEKPGKSEKTAKKADL